MPQQPFPSPSYGAPTQGSPPQIPPGKSFMFKLKRVNKSLKL